MAKRRSAVPHEDVAELFRFYSLCFDRPAFQDVIRQEGSMEDFDKAIEGTITGLNSGCLRSRDGQVLATGKGKSFLTGPHRVAMDHIVDLLREIRTRYATAVQTGKIRLGAELTNGDRWYCINDGSLADWFDQQRAEVIRRFNELCDDVGIPPLTFPRLRGRSGY